jgi:hypothetical protein
MRDDPVGDLRFFDKRDNFPGIPWLIGFFHLSLLDFGHLLLSHLLIV